MTTRTRKAGMWDGAPRGWKPVTVVKVPEMVKVFNERAKNASPELRAELYSILEGFLNPTGNNWGYSTPNPSDPTLREYY